VGRRDQVSVSSVDDGCHRNRKDQKFGRNHRKYRCSETGTGTFLAARPPGPPQQTQDGAAGQEWDDGGSGRLSQDTQPFGLDQPIPPETTRCQGEQSDSDRTQTETAPQVNDMRVRSRLDPCLRSEAGKNCQREIHHDSGSAHRVLAEKRHRLDQRR